MSKSKSVTDFISGLLNEASGNREADKTNASLPASGPGTQVNDPSDSNNSQGGPDPLTKGKDEFTNQNKLNNVGTKSAKKRKADKDNISMPPQKLGEAKDEDGESDGESDGGSDGKSDGDKDGKKKENPFVKKEACGDDDKSKSDGDEDKDEDDKKKMKEHIDAIFSDESLSEDFKTRAITVFEAAVNERVTAKRTKLEEQFQDILAEEVEAARTDSLEKVNDYLDFVVEKWVEDNRLVLESALRAELSESLIAGMKNVFESHYIDIPEEKVDVVAEISEKAMKLEEQLNANIESQIALQKELNELKKQSIFNTMSESLALTEKDKFKNLCENVVFDNDGDYKAKLTTIFSSYFKKNATNPVEINEATHTQTGGENKPLSEVERIANYVTSRSQK